MPNSIQTGQSLHRRHYRPDIDGLRAIAVSVVVLCHAFPRWLPGGFVGVDIFFVLSGYLISGILLNDLEQERFSIALFYRRRVARIFPALIVVLLFIGLVGWGCLFRPEFAALGRHLVASTAFVENFLLWRQAGYFDVASTLKPTLHLWSLAIEEQFYIVWPVVLYLAHRRRLNVGLVIGALAVLSFIANAHAAFTDPDAAYYSPLGRSWELMVGAGLAYVSRHHAAWLARGGSLRSAFGLGLLILALVLIRPTRAFPGFWALLPTLGTVLLVSGGAEAWVNRRLLDQPPMIWCGLISYPLYLWHWPLLSFADIVFSEHVSTHKILICVTLAVGLATLTFFYVERPFRHRGPEPRGTRLLVGAMVGVLVVGVLIMSRWLPPRLHRFDAPEHTEWDYFLEKNPDLGTNPVGVFTLGTGRAPGVMFIGDSHLAQYATRLDRLVAQDHARPGVTMAIGGFCIPIPGATTDKPAAAPCWPMREAAFQRALAEPFDTVAVGGAWNRYFLGDNYGAASVDFTIDDRGTELPLTSSAGRQVALTRLGQQLAQLVHAGKRVVLILDNPRSNKFDPASQGVRLGFSGRQFDPRRTIPLPADQRALSAEMRAVAQAAGAGVIDPADTVCPGGQTCHVVDATGRPLYIDDGHLNPDWVADHATFIDGVFRR